MTRPASMLLKDKTVMHVFRLQDGKVTRFDVQDAS